MTILNESRFEPTNEAAGGMPQAPKVLVVDDVEANLALVAAMIEPLECAVVLASSAAQALALTRTHEFAVLLLDVHMPDIDGYALAEQIRLEEATRELPIIFLTAAHPDDDKELRGYDSGAVDFLFKPLDSVILCSKVRVFLQLYESKRNVVEAKAAVQRAYDELKATQAQLIQSAKMASLGQLVAGVAHEINNPLSFVTSHLGTARRSLERVDSHFGTSRPDAINDDWERASDRLREMQVGLERISDLVLKLRTFSRLDEGEQKHVSVRECVESVLMILKHRMKDRIAVHTDFDEPDFIQCYPGLLTQAIMNLVSNSIDGIPNSGEIAIRAGGGESGYHIVIRDTGTGIPEALRDRVFEPFFTTKGVGDGVGLGLSISYAIVEKHGGKLSLECPAEGGTIASIVLPLVDS